MRSRFSKDSVIQQGALIGADYNRLGIVLRYMTRFRFGETTDISDSVFTRIYALVYIGRMDFIIELQPVQQLFFGVNNIVSLSDSFGEPAGRRNFNNNNNNFN